MNQPAPQKSKSAIRFAGFSLFVILLFTGFIAGWYWAAGKLDDTASGYKQKLARLGTVLDCKNQDVRGFPFRLGIFCSSFTYVDPVNAIQLTVGALRTAAQIYNPGHIIAELDGPLDVTMPNLAPLNMTWETLRTSTKISTSDLQALSIEAKALDIAANDAGTRSPLATIEALEIHARPTPQDPASLDFAATLNGWQIDSGTMDNIEPVNFTMNISLDDGFAALQEHSDILQLLRQQGASGVIRELMLTTSTGGELAISGPLKIATDGKLSGELTLDLTDPQTLARYAGKVFPPLEASISEILPFIPTSPDNTVGQMKVKNLKLTIEQGRIMLGFIQIGEIPPLF